MTDYKRVEYIIDTMVQPDGIKLWVKHPFWLETYDELFALIVALDKLYNNPKAMTVGEEQ